MAHSRMFFDWCYRNVVTHAITFSSLPVPVPISQSKTRKLLHLFFHLKPHFTHCLTQSRSRNREQKRKDRDALIETSTVLGVFGMSLLTTEQEIQSECSKFAPVKNVHLITDSMTRRSRGLHIHVASPVYRRI